MYIAPVEERAHCDELPKSHVPFSKCSFFIFLARCKSHGKVGRENLNHNRPIGEELAN